MELSWQYYILFRINTLTVTFFGEYMLCVFHSDVMYFVFRDKLSNVVYNKVLRGDVKVTYYLLVIE